MKNTLVLELDEDASMTEVLSDRAPCPSVLRDWFAMLVGNLTRHFVQKQ